MTRYDLECGALLPAEHGAWVSYMPAMAEHNRLRSLLERAHSIISIREAGMRTAKGEAWLAEMEGRPMRNVVSP